MVNDRVKSLNKSATLKITALTKSLIREGKDVVNFAAGEPDFDTPDFIKAEAIKAIEQGFTKYTPSAGIPALKEAIASKLLRENNIKTESSNVLVTTGAKYALYVALLSLVEPGDEVIVPMPYWVSYPEMISLIGGQFRPLLTEKEKDFKIDINVLKKQITSKTKVIVLNYPSNPTGVTYTRQELSEIAKIVEQFNLYVISDEIYEKLIYDGRKHISFASLSGMDKRTLTVNGFSKAYSMTGWRLGYLAGPNEIISQASKIIDHTTSCAVSFSQQAAVAALENKTWAEDLCLKFQERRDLLWQGLSTLDKIKPIKSQGTFYMFCDVTQTGLSALEFADQLLKQQMVSCIPAESFGIEGYIRLSFATGNGQIKKGVARITDFLNGI